MALERIVKRFYDELENGKMMGRKCTRCGAVEFPPVLCCNECSCMDMEWVEISGKAEMTGFALPGMLSTLPQNEEFQPYALGAVKLEEGTEFNAIVSGVGRANREEVLKKLPVPIKARIAPRDGYSMVVFDLVEEN